MKKLATLLLVVCLVLPLAWVLPVFGEDEDELVNSQKARGGRGTTLYVGAGQTYTTIGAAISVASPGDTISVYAGTYYENVVVDKTVTLIGNGTSNTTIDYIGNGDGMRITANWVNVSRFTITNSDEWGAGIEIYFSDYCRIEECNISNNENCGISLSSSSNNTIFNNNLVNNYVDIYFDSSNNNSITNNNVSNSTFGGAINIFSSNNNIIANNTCSNISSYSIQLGSSSNNNIANNTCSNNSYGIQLYSSSNNTLANNTCSNNDWGIGLTSSSNNTLANNTCSNNSRGGIYLEISSSNTIANNTCSNNNDGIYLEISSSNTIANNTCSNNNDGIKLHGYSSGNTLKNNICSNNWLGINLDSSSSNTIENNSMANDGIRIYGNLLEHWNTHNISTSNKVNGKPVYYWKNVNDGDVPSGAGQVILANCTNIKVESQNLSNVYVGILLGFSINNNIANNTCSNNYYGIYLDGYWGSCNSNTFMNNTCNSNLYGIYIKKSENNTIINNIVALNNNYGICFIDADNNTIYNNNFIDNHNQAWDDSTNGNQWNSSKPNGGNYWSDWTTPDSNNDGFVDDPYNMIEGDAGAKDNWPFTFENGWEFPVHNLNQDTWHQNIQEAIDLAAMGHTIWVRSGTYYENVIIKKAITLIGDDRNTTVIDGGGNGDVVKITADWVNISGFTITNSGDTEYPDYDAGIEIFYSDNCKIEDCIYSNNTAGIFLVESMDNIIENNDYSNNYMGIILWNNSKSNTITNNTCNSNNANGIFIYRYSNNNILDNNTCNSNNYCGINLWSSMDNIIKNNNCSKNNDDGIWLEANSNNNILENNICNSNKNTGIHLINNPRENIIVNNICNSNTWTGIWVDHNSRSNMLENNTCNANTLNGIYISDSESNTLNNNTCNSNTENGIFLKGSTDNIIDNNNFSNNDRGVMLENNSDSNMLENNNCNSNNDYGIYINESESNTITNNIVSSNSNYGIYLIGAINNKIFNNNFFENVKQAYDNSANKNQWNSPEPTGGNYWSDWTSPDNDKDGFVDKPYNIDGPAGAKDYLPLVHPWGKIPLQIITQDVQIAYVEQLFSVNYTAFDPDTPNNELTWTMETNASWLNFSEEQELYGTPSTSDIGSYWVNISVRDETNLDFTNFTLTVLAKISLQITTTNIITAYVGQLYSVNYTASDQDTPLNNLTWTMNTNASWVNFSFSQRLFGTPSSSDVGYYWVNISVTYMNNSDFTNFTLTVFQYEAPNITTPEIVTTSLNYNATNVTVNNTQIIIKFSKPMNTSSVEEAFSITPHVNYNLVWNDNSTELIITFNQKLSYDTTYTITINTNAKDMYGNQLESPLELVFTTQKESKPGGDDGKPKNGDFLLRIVIGSLLLLVLIILIISALVTKSRRKMKESAEKKATQIEGRSEVKGLDITEKYTYDELVIGNAEDYLKKLMDESLEFKKPSEFKTPEEKMLKEAKEKYRKGKISKATYESITETLIEKKH